MSDNERYAKLHRGFRHWVYRDHPHHPDCNGCIEAAAFLVIPGFRGTEQPLTDGR